MGRDHRPAHAGLFHVMSRSVAGEHVFDTDADYVDGVHQLGRLVTEDLVRCHAFCLMPTHYHVVVSVGDGGPATAVQRLNRRYAGGFNRRHGRRGHVFDSPYLAVEVVEEAHLLVLIAYLAHNPGSRLDWPWSSYAGTVGEREPFGFVDPKPFLDAFGTRDRLRRFVEGWQPRQDDPVYLVQGHVPVPGTGASAHTSVASRDQISTSPRRPAFR